MTRYLLLEWTEGTSCRAGIDEKLVVLFERLELMRVSGDKHVDVELTLQHGQALLVAPRNHLMAVCETDAKLAHRDHFLLRIVQILPSKSQASIKIYV